MAIKIASKHFEIESV